VATPAMALTTPGSGKKVQGRTCDEGCSLVSSSKDGGVVWGNWRGGDGGGKGGWGGMLGGGGWGEVSWGGGCKCDVW